MARVRVLLSAQPRRFASSLTCFIGPTCKTGPFRMTNLLEHPSPKPFTLKYLAMETVGVAECPDSIFRHNSARPPSCHRRLDLLSCPCSPIPVHRSLGHWRAAPHPPITSKTGLRNCETVEPANFIRINSKSRTARSATETQDL